ncbi:MAG: hypothetical protein COA79_01360 [Planctomycetota bacterium]|nr:MAG: hypothetical protein COA79_01360 [Planctomycetota bacterium]
MMKSNLSQVLQKFITEENQCVNTTEILNEVSNQKLLPVDPYQDFTIKVVRTFDDRVRAYRFMYKIYLEKEFAEVNTSRMWYSLYDAHPNTITFIAEKSDEVIGAITVVMDSEMGLSANELYADEISEMKSRNHRPAEIISLGVKSGQKDAKKILIKLFNNIYFAARGVFSVTDLIITVNPRHQKFYSRVLTFDTLGIPKEYNKVGGAVAVLLNLNLKKVEMLVEMSRTVKVTKGIIYEYFYTIKEKKDIVESIKSSINPMSLREFDYFFNSNFFLGDPQSHHFKHLKKYFHKIFVLDIFFNYN